MSDHLSQSDEQLLAELNDLLQLDHDAVQAYTVAVDNLRGEPFRTTVRTFRGDHERHITDLTGVIQARGGTPVDLPHVATGFLKLALEKAAAAAGGDRELLLAFKANEGQVRDKYRRAAGLTLADEVSAVVRRNAGDEERHYAWVTQALEALGAAGRTPVERAEVAVEAVHGGTADVIEAGEREAMGAADAAREGVAAAGDRARDLAADAGDRALKAAGSGLEGAGRGLDRAAGWADERGGVAARAAAPVHHFADVLEQEGVNLRQQDLDAVRRDVERGVRSHPVRSVLIAAGLGYLVGRMLR